MGALAMVVLALAVGAGLAAVALWPSRAAARREAAALRDALLASQAAVVAGRLVASAAHDLGNQLIVMRMKLREMRGSTPQECATHLPGLEEAAGAIQDLSRRMGELAVPAGPPGRRGLDLRQAVEEAMALARGHTQVRHCSIQLDAGPEAVARVDAGLVRALVFHLLVGAAEAGEGRRALAVSVSPAAGGWTVRVDRDGPPGPWEEGGPSGLAVLRACASAQGAHVGPVPSRLGGAAVEIRFATE